MGGKIQQKAIAEKYSKEIISTNGTVHVYPKNWLSKVKLLIMAFLGILLGIF